MKKINIILKTLCLVLIVFSSACNQWEELAKDNLDGFEQLNGTAPFILEDGVIIGTAVTNSPNSFLCTKEKYGDFILEFDTWFDPQMNSGVQFRSESTPDYRDGRVHGYQVEMDPSDRAWSGGIYDEARRGWLYSLEKNPEGKKALKVGEWNHYRVEAIGNSIRTWVNGIPCADLVDDLTPSGFIAFQVHSIGSDESKAGIQVKWKNIRIITKNLDKHKTPYTPVIPQVSFLENKLTEREIEEGWKLLFDGETSEGWINAGTNSFPEGDAWEVKDGMLIINDVSSRSERRSGGDIVTTEKFVNFEFSVDFMYAEGANSGIKYFIDIESYDGARASIGCEYQILDDLNHPDAKMGKDGNRTLSGLYDLITPVNKRDNGIDQWNRATIIVNGDKVQHWLNGYKTVEYVRGSDTWFELVAESKYRNYDGFGMTKDTRILLQDHYNLVRFKNIKIREIK
jgi:hypothetical protein